ncbi:MAG: lactonase family protein [Bacteroidetes bacterium]|nr:MAG: lactonase family protein [Bacteroidota bacterium]
MIAKSLPLLLLTTWVLACTPPPAAETAAAPEAYWLYVASGNGATGGGIGIYRFWPASGEVVAVDTSAEVPASSYLAVADDRLYSLHSDSSGAGILAALAVDPATGAVSLLGEALTGGQGPCYVSVAGNTVLVANYSSGNISATRRTPQGLGPQTGRIQHEGHSVNPDRQEAPHPHMIIPVPGTDLVLVPDLGTDQVFAYQLDEMGALSPAPVPHIAISPGAGPRHMALHPSQPRAYILNELNATVSSLELDPAQGLTAVLSTASTLPPDFDEYNKSSDIHITPDGRYLYAANRGPNSLAIFDLTASPDSLKLVDIVDCGGEWPRAFAIDPTGQFVLVANMYSNQISVFRIDSATGRLSKEHEIPSVSSPQGLRFVPVKG